MEGVGERTTEMGNELDSLASLNPRHAPCYVAPPVSGTEHPTQEQSEGERRGDKTHRAVGGFEDAVAEARSNWSGVLTAI